MKTQRLLIALTVINLGLLAVLLFSQARPALADSPPSVIRGRGLQIVDERGKVRASIKIHPASTVKETGENLPETVMFRLIDPNGRPAVKIGASVDGSAMSLAGDSERREWSGAQVLAKGTGTSVILTNKDGKKQVVNP